jgi:hypothetical protein
MPLPEGPALALIGTMSAHFGPLRIRYSWWGIQIYRLTTSQSIDA